MLPRRQHHDRRCDKRAAVLDDLVGSPERLLARAAEHDARRAHEAVAMLSNARLLEVVIAQAQLAVEPGRTRSAGIDALAELDRAAVELMNIPSGASVGTTPAGEPPLVTGWDLITLAGADELAGATTSVLARPWHLALIAFADVSSADGVERSVTAATADMRFVALRLRIVGSADRAEDAAVLDACVSHRLDDLGARSSVAWGLWCALAGAVEQR
jgi:hypothetical protein